MTRSSNRVPRELADAAAVHAARDAVVVALGPLAASPLDEQATSRMRAALDRAHSPAVRQAIRRLSRPGESRPPLQAVPPMTTDRTADSRQPTYRRTRQFVVADFAPEGAA
ncbi:MAG: hypothetical protein ACRCYU_20590 [Nocardioides sp.]